MRLKACLIASCLLAGRSAHAAESTPSALSLEERVRAHRAVERVRWSHREWPSENSGGRPQFDETLPVSIAREQVTDALRKSAALWHKWGRPLTKTQIQAELDRLVRTSRDRVRLREMFDALGNDPRLIAETIARPILADRLIRSWYTGDARYHAALRQRAEATRSGVRSVGDLKTLGGDYEEELLRLQQPAEAGAVGPDFKWTMRPGSRERVITKREMDEARSRLEAMGLHPGAVSEVEDAGDAFLIRAWISESPGELRTAVVRWRKRSFEEWWAIGRLVIPPDLSTEQNGSYSVPPFSASACADDTWTGPMEWTAPSPRRFAKAVWTGSEMLVWGGENDNTFSVAFAFDGGRYDPATDTWSPMSTGPIAPCGSKYHSAVWTGAEMINWGGVPASSPGGSTNEGARYNPTTDTWVFTSTGANCPTNRYVHTAVWTGIEMIVWGGFGCVGGNCGDGARYVPASDTWIPMSQGAGAPTARSSASAVWTNGKMIVWGGGATGALNSGAAYNPSNDTWTTVNQTGAPAARFGHTAVWTGTEMIVWGGTNQFGGQLKSGARYKPSTNSWQATLSTGPTVPLGRDSHLAVWTGIEMIVFGGSKEDGGRYSPTTNTWIPMTSMPGFFGSTGVWSGSELIFWADSLTSQLGGRYSPGNNVWIPIGVGGAARYNSQSARVTWTGSEMLMWGNGSATGTSYELATNAWSFMGLGGAPPLGRAFHAQAWTGRELLVWGGFSGSSGQWETSGGKYDPITASWLPTGMGASVASARIEPSHLWSGKELIVWGGRDPATNQDVGTGSRYDPARDAWTPMSVTGSTPQPRETTPAVWTGKEMIVWGGYSTQTAGRVNTGGRYDPEADTWTPTSTGANNPSLRGLHSLVWAADRTIVWGGYDNAAITLDSGGRYDPVTNTWLPTALGATTPTPRRGHATVWTGSEMIVWGGAGVPGGVIGLPPLGSGGRYDPVADTWRATGTGQGAMSQRDWPLSVWTGSQMILWGGQDYRPNCSDQYLYSGSLYCAGPCQAPGIVTGLQLERDGLNGAYLTWSSASPASRSDVVWGGLSALRTSGGNFTNSTYGCLADSTPAPNALDLSLPFPGDGFWYLVRAEGCLPGTFDSAGSSQIGLRDSEIGASLSACP